MNNMRVPVEVMEQYQDAFKRNNKYSENDFDLEYSEQPIPPHVISPIRGELRVINKLSHKEKTYVTGHLSSWSIDFENDLNTGFFD